MPSSLQRTTTSWAASIAAYGEDSSRSAFTFCPPDTFTNVSFPLRSVTCYIVKERERERERERVRERERERETREREREREVEREREREYVS